MCTCSLRIEYGYSILNRLGVSVGVYECMYVSKIHRNRGCAHEAYVQRMVIESLYVSVGVCECMCVCVYVRSTEIVDVVPTKVRTENGY
jgi:hypothetical protein